MRVRSSALALALVLCAGCDIGKLVDNITTHSELGVISPDMPSLFPSTPTNAVAPDTATRGVPFTVSVQTRGVGCWKGIDRTDVTYAAADTAVVRPYDFVNDPCAGYGDKLVLAPPHKASVTFANPGVATVRFEGVREADRSPVTITRTVVIR